jgi:hypothetical protein
MKRLLIRRATLGNALLLALAVSLATTGASRAEECKKYAFDYLTDGSKDQTIDAILDWADCIQKDQESRVGKYFCFIENTAGIQYNKDGSTFVGGIKPINEKFFVEIRPFHTRDTRRLACDRAFGLLYPGGWEPDPDNPGKFKRVDGKWSGNFSGPNTCLANYSWKFSVDDFSCDGSTYTWGCNSEYRGTFDLSKKNEFNWYREYNFSEYPSNLYVSQGKCEKIGE